MSRRHAAEKREVLPDAKFGDLVITKFINSLMYAGKKSTAETIVYGALTQVEKKSKADPVKAFHDALDNVKPHLEVRSRRVGGATYQVPVEVRPDRAQALAIRWIIQTARGRSEQTIDNLRTKRPGGRAEQLVRRGLTDLLHELIPELLLNQNRANTVIVLHDLFD